MFPIPHRLAAIPRPIDQIDPMPERIVVECFGASMESVLTPTELRMVHRMLRRGGEATVEATERGNVITITRPA